MKPAQTNPTLSAEQLVWLSLFIHNNSTRRDSSSAAGNSRQRFQPHGDQTLGTKPTHRVSKTSSLNTIAAAEVTTTLEGKVDLIRMAGTPGMFDYLGYLGHLEHLEHLIWKIWKILASPEHSRYLEYLQYVKCCNI